MSKVKPNINQKMIQLDELLTWFDGDNFELEEAVDRFSAAQKLANEIEQNLLEMKNIITVISERFDQEK